MPIMPWHGPPRNEDNGTPHYLRYAPWCENRIDDTHEVALKDKADKTRSAIASAPRLDRYIVHSKIKLK